MTEIEQWRPVKGLEGLYEVSDRGGVRSLERPLTYKDGRKGTRRPRVLTGCVNKKNGYHYVVVGGRHRNTHVLVLEAFTEKPAGAQVVNHIDGDKLNNTLSNLEWTTYAENNRHARRTGLNKQHGEHCNLSRYSEKHVQAVRVLYSSGEFTQLDISQVLGMHYNQVHDILKGKTRVKA